MRPRAVGGFLLVEIPIGSCTLLSSSSSPVPSATVTGLRDDTPTSCMPSLININFPLINTEYWCIPFKNLMREFESRLELVLHSLEVNSVPITMSNTTWDIPVNQYGKFNAAALNKVFAAIELEPYDYVFITTLPDMEVRIIIFSGIDDAERIYDWFGDNQNNAVNYRSIADYGLCVISFSF